MDVRPAPHDDFQGPAVVPTLCAPPTVPLITGYNPDALAGRAPCGCPLSEVEEEHRKLDEKQRRRVAWFIVDLRSIKGRVEPRLPTSLAPGDLTEGHIRGRWRYFKWLYADDPKSFPGHVQTYERAHEAVWLKPPCKRGVALLYQGDVEGLPIAKDHEPARRRGGGRRPNPAIQQRDERIAALFAAPDALTYGVAKQLDDEGLSIPASWIPLLPQDQRTWMHAMSNPTTKRTAEKFFSKQRRRASRGA